MFPFLPYPPDDGGRIGFFNPIKYLSRKSELSVVCLTEEKDEGASIEELRKFCVELRTYQRPTGHDNYRLAKGAVFSPPGSAAKYWHPAVGGLIREIAERRGAEVVEFHHLNTAIYRRYAGDRPVMLREHNVEYKVWERFAESADTLRQRVYGRWSAPRVRTYEAKAAVSFDRCVVVTPTDAEHLRAVAPEARIEVIPSGVDTEYFCPADEVEEEPFSITITGSFDWKPKQRSLAVLLTDVFPRIRAKENRAKLYVVGKGVPENLRRVAEGTLGVKVIGAVPDVRPYVWRSSLVINYLESGGGIALKVLEAMMMRKAVLTNALGCEGLQVQHGRTIFVADGAEKFAEAAARLLVDQSLRRRLAESASETAMELYSWHAVAGRFQAAYEEMIEEAREKKSAMELTRAGHHGVESAITRAGD